jgi:integrase/recombinase XerD
MFEVYITAIRSKTTAARYTHSVQGFLAWMTAWGVPLAKAPKDTLGLYAHAQLEAGYNPASVSADLAGIRRYLRWAKEKRGAILPDFFSAELPKPKRRVKDMLSPEMLSHYFRLAKEVEEPARTAVMLLPCTGLRGGEMVGLSLDCIKRSPYKRADGTVKDTLTITVVGKGSHERVVPVLDEGVALLMAYLQGWRRTSKNKRYLFPGKSEGEHLSSRMLRKVVQDIREPLRMQFTPHTMRRTYLTHLYRQGVDITALAKIAGHTDVRVLIKSYLALDEHDVVKAVHAAGGRLV